MLKLMMPSQRKQVLQNKFSKMKITSVPNLNEDPKFKGMD
jgi:hypothetical protein